MTLSICGERGGEKKRRKEERAQVEVNPQIRANEGTGKGC